MPYTAAEMGELLATVSTAFTKLQTNAPQNVMYITDYKVGVQKNGHLKHSVSITSYTTDEDGTGGTEKRTDKVTINNKYNGISRTY